MAKIFFATGNKNKLAELKVLVEPLGVEVVSPRDYPEYIAPEETGKTFFENAEIKARAACDYTGLPALADDSGLVVPALNGEPGVYSARYSGENATDDENNVKLLKIMADMEVDDRKACFCAVLCFVTPGGEVCFSEGKVEGHLLKEYRGEKGFGYDPIFFIDEIGKGMAEIDLAEKNKISHRSRAFAGIFNALNTHYSKNA